MQFSKLRLAALALAPALCAGQEADAPKDWDLRAQATYVWQAKPAMRSPYEGPNSLSSARERSYSFTATAFMGLRLTHSTELYFNPEAAQGVALSNLTGLSGFTNGELAKTSGPRLTTYPARLFLRQVIGLGGEPQKVDAGQNQLAATYDSRRIAITAGAFSALDLFDANRYAKDSRTQFMNWAFMTHAAYDYPADARGYTRGVAAEYFDGPWSARAARLAVPREPNGLALDPHLGSRFGDQVEIAREHEIAGRHGSARLLAFRVRASMASYQEALALAAPGQPPTLDSARDATRDKRGWGAAFDQEVADGVGVFGRFARADGKTETYAFTEADASSSMGLSASGSRWGRPGDAAGLAVARASLSGAHREFLSRGGATFFLGDGRLAYGAEKVLELYYSADLGGGAKLTADWQRIANPGFNKDRGPASFFAARLHWEL